MNKDKLIRRMIGRPHSKSDLERIAKDLEGEFQHASEYIMIKTDNLEGFYFRKYEDGLYYYFNPYYIEG